MGPGTIVVCLPSIVNNPNVVWVPVMDGKTPYQIRKFIKARPGIAKVDCVYFEEGVIGWYNNKEIAFPAKYLREILPPDEVSKEVAEVLKEPVLTSYP